MLLRDTLLAVLVAEIAAIILWKSLRYLKIDDTGTTQETDLRLTYKRYMELYPNSTISYPEYKALQARKAYKKAVNSMNIKRMVR